MNKVRDARRFALGALIVRAIGFIAGILTAPKSGKETREDLKNSANRVISESEKELKKLHAELAVVIENTKQVLSGKTGKAKQDIEAALVVAREKQSKVKELLSALRDGGASDDPELSKSLKEASKAVKHLKEFMTK